MQTTILSVYEISHLAFYAVVLIFVPARVTV